MKNGVNIASVVAPCQGSDFAPRFWNSMVPAFTVATKVTRLFSLKLTCFFVPLAVRIGTPADVGVTIKIISWYGFLGCNDSLCYKSGEEFITPDSDIRFYSILQLRLQSSLRDRLFDEFFLCQQLGFLWCCADSLILWYYFHNWRGAHAQQNNHMLSPPILNTILSNILSYFRKHWVSWAKMYSAVLRAGNSCFARGVVIPYRPVLIEALPVSEGSSNHWWITYCCRRWTFWGGKVCLSSYQESLAIYSGSRARISWDVIAGQPTSMEPKG